MANSNILYNIFVQILKEIIQQVKENSQYLGEIEFEVIVNYAATEIEKDARSYLDEFENRRRTSQYIADFAIKEKLKIVLKPERYVTPL